MLPRWLSGKGSTCQCKRHGIDPSEEDPLKKKTATHSSILAWGIPWTEKSSRLHGVVESDTTEHACTAEGL